VASRGRKPVLTITAAEVKALMPHVHQACRALQCLTAMHAAARLSGQAKATRVAARRLAAFQRRLDALTSGLSEDRGRPGGDPSDRPGFPGAAAGALHELSTGSHVASFGMA
jgi:hypothetical protein